MKLKFLFVAWNHIDLYSLCLNLAIVIMIFKESNQVMIIRRIEAAAAILMWLKFLYFLRIINATAPLVRMIQEIISDMKSFFIVYCICMFAFANAFYLIGRNQLEHNIESPSYSTLLGSIRNVYLASIGDFQYDTYNGSDDEHYLWVLLILTTLINLIVLLNILIAIMSTTFSRVAETSQSSILQERLQLIIENMGALPSIRNKDKKKYLISIQPTSEITP